VAITNAKVIKLQCQDSKPNATSTARMPSDMGAVALEIPCNCKATIDGKKSLRSPFPCLLYKDALTAAVVHMIPAQWSTLRYVL
jgi:hypothetical protein